MLQRLEFPGTKTLEMSQVVESSKELSDIIKLKIASGKIEQPDLVLSIARGGVLVGAIVANELGLQHQTILIGRCLKLDELYSNPNIPHFLARLIHGYRFIKTPTEVLKAQPLVGKKVLIVDDTYHTGKTLKSAQDFVTSQGSGIVSIAVVNTVKENIDPKIISSFKGRAWFPWTKNHKDYSQFKRELETLPKEIQEIVN